MVREGRSGARHEIDVLAEKGDGLTTFSLMVECKAWDRPVDKEVLAKAAFVGADVGADKTIVVALQGATGGAALSAAELGVELWGPEELERRLGRVSLAALGRDAARRRRSASPSPSTRRAPPVWPSGSAPRACSGLGGRGGRLVRPALAALPAAHAGLHPAGGPPAQTGASLVGLQPLRGPRREPARKLPGRSRPSPRSRSAGPRLPARVKARALHGEIATTLLKWRSVVQDAARERWARAALELGVPLPVEALTIDETTACWLPVYVAVLAERRAPGGGDRCRRRRGRPRLAAVLTANLGYVTEALDSADTVAAPVTRREPLRPCDRDQI